MATYQRSSRPRATAGLLTAATCALLAADHASAQWTIEPRVRAGAEFDDNATLAIRTDEEISLDGLLFDVSANFGYDAARTEFDLEPLVRSNNYSDNPELESTDVFVGSRLTHQLQSSNLALRVNYDRQTTRTGERADADFNEELDDFIGDDSGQVGTVGMREKWRFRPAWFFDISNVTRIGAELEYTDVQYDEDFAGLLEDYTDSRIDLNYERDVSDRTTTLVRLTGRVYDADADMAEEITGYGGQVGLRHELSPTTRVTALVGVEDTDTASAEPVGEVTVIRRLETISISAQFRRNLNASGVGRVSVRDQINVNFTRQLSERFTAGIGVRAYRTERLEDDTFTGTPAARDYVQLRSSFVWNITRDFAFEADYRYTILDRSNVTGESSNSNRIGFWLIYQPNAIN